MAVPQEIRSGPALEYFQKIASGPLGSVWLARLATGDEAGRPVAARCLPLAELDPSEVERVLRVTADYVPIAHPRLAKGLGAFCRDGQLIILGEHVEGLPLTSLRRMVFAQHVSVAPAVTLRIVHDVLNGAEALLRECARGGRTVPKRLVFADTVTIAGFGESLLSAVGVAEELYRCRSIRGLPELAEALAPEEIAGTEPPDERADVFALGVLLWELIAGRRLFRRESYEQILRAVLHAPIPPLEEIELAGHLFAEPIAAIVRGATSREPGLRYSSLSEMCTAIEQLCSEHLATDAEVQALLATIAGDGLDPRWGGGSAARWLGSGSDPSSSRIRLAATGWPPRSGVRFPRDLATTGDRDLPDEPDLPRAEASPVSAPATAVTFGDTHARSAPTRHRWAKIAAVALLLAGAGALVLPEASRWFAARTASSTARQRSSTVAEGPFVGSRTTTEPGAPLDGRRRAVADARDAGYAPRAQRGERHSPSAQSGSPEPLRPVPSSAAPEQREQAPAPKHVDAAVPVDSVPQQEQGISEATEALDPVLDEAEPADADQPHNRWGI